MLEKITAEVIAEAIQTLGRADVGESAVDSRIASLAPDSITACRLKLFIPEAFGTVLVSHLGKVTLSAMFSARTQSGKWKSLSLSGEPVFVEALRMAQAMYHDGPRDIFQNVANRSSIFNTANNALNAGAALDGSVFSGPAVNGIPAEIYPDFQRPFWRTWLSHFRFGIKMSKLAD